MAGVCSRVIMDEETKTQEPVTQADEGKGGETPVVREEGNAGDTSAVIPDAAETPKAFASPDQFGVVDLAIGPRM